MERNTTNEAQEVRAMPKKEAIFWLQAILDDTLDPLDDTDAKRIEAVELAIKLLREH